jgi:hypothetical protein
MTATILFERLRQLKPIPAEIDDTILLDWLNQVEGQILHEIFLLALSEITPYSATPTEALAAPYPYDGIYWLWMEAQVDFANGEYERYTNTMQRYNTAWNDLARHIAKCIRPVYGRAVEQGYYLSAYGIAKAHGYTGTEAEWLDSLKGAAGAPGKDGKPFRWRGAWDASTSYAKLDAVEHNGSCYVWTDDADSTAGDEPGVDELWELCAAKGAKGAKGDPGAAGAPGPQGLTGPQGPQGEKGEKGDTGPQGPQGEKGEKGDTGPQGPQGPAGSGGSAELPPVLGNLAAQIGDAAAGTIPVYAGDEAWEIAKLIKDYTGDNDLIGYIPDTTWVAAYMAAQKTLLKLLPDSAAADAGKLLQVGADGAAAWGSKLPTSLKNPKALTFTGAATGTYDGSEDLTVNIPAGGSSGSGGALKAMSAVGGYIGIPAADLPENGVVWMCIADGATNQEYYSGTITMQGGALSSNNMVSISSNGVIQLNQVAQVSDGIVIYGMSASAYTGVYQVVGAGGGSSINWRGEYSAQTAYNRLDAVSYKGSSYVFVSATSTTGAIPGIDEEWQLLAQKGDSGESLSLGMTSAAVGQIAKISAVDANGVPTAWEPVDMPSGSASEGNALTSSERNLILTLFKTVPYTADVSKTVKSLEKIWTGAATYYTVTYSLTSVTANNQETRIIEGGTLEINLTPDAGTEITNVVVTMSGVDVTEGVYSNNKIAIYPVTGNVTITAAATSAAYTAIEYLQGDGTAYIKTDYFPSVGDLVELKFAATQTDWDYVFSMYKRGSALYGFITRMAYTAGTSTGFTRRLPSDGTDYNARVAFNCEQNVVYTLKEMEPGKATIYNEAGEGLLTMVDEKASTFAEPTNPIFLWTQSNEDTPWGVNRCKTRIYAFKIKDAYGETKMDLIPVLDGNGVACLYDKVTKSFLYDAAGGNTFIAGGTI